jgi:hypothetical protein
VPGYVLHIALLIPWITLATAVWIAAFVMYLFRSRFAQPLALAMVATFPAVFLFQLIGGLADIIVLLLAAAVGRFGRYGPVSDAIVGRLGLSESVLMLSLSALGS